MAHFPLRPSLAALRRYYGAPAAPASRDPFPLILWEQVAYLVADSRRKEAFTALRRRVGLTPAAIAAARQSELVAIARIGGSIAAPVRATRMRQSAERVLGEWDGQLKRALRLPVPQARRALAAFAMIGEPGADKILLQTRTARLLPLDSNGMRVLLRLGLSSGGKDYRSTYRKVQAALAPLLPADFPWLISAHQLLRLHGQVLCRRSAPRCGECPLSRGCPFPGRSAQ